METPIVKYDYQNKEYVVMYAGKGGATITDKDRNVAISKWNDAMKLSRAVSKFLNIKK